jgi:hypothetical protein
VRLSVAGQLPDPEDFHPWSLTEWVESTMVFESLDEISRTEIVDRFPTGMKPNQDEIDRALREIRRRSSAAPGLYPFRATDSRVERPGGVDATVNDFLVLAALRWAPYRDQDSSRFEEVNPAFELLAREALVRHLGPGAEGRRMAWPARDDRPKAFPEALEWLALEMSLETGSLADTDTVLNDGGVDVVAWRSFSDGHPGHLCILAQCTVQVVDYAGKIHDIEPLEWLSWIRFGRPPATALVIPFVIPADAMTWPRLSKRADLIIDRTRLLELLDGSDLTGFPEWLEMADFIVKERNEIATRLAAPVTPTGTKKARPPQPAPRPRAIRRHPDDGGPDFIPARRPGAKTEPRQPAHIPRFADRIDAAGAVDDMPHADRRSEDDEPEPPN